MAERHFCEAVMGECTALVCLPYTVSGMQSRRCGHRWRIARAAAVFLAAVLLVQASTTQQPAQKLGTWNDGTCNNGALGDAQGMRCARG